MLFDCKTTVHLNLVKSIFFIFFSINIFSGKQRKQFNYKQDLDGKQTRLEAVYNVERSTTTDEKKERGFPPPLPVSLFRRKIISFYRKLEHLRDWQKSAFSNGS